MPTPWRRRRDFNLTIPARAIICSVSNLHYSVVWAGHRGADTPMLTARDKHVKYSFVALATVSNLRKAVK